MGGDVLVGRSCTTLSSMEHTVKVYGEEEMRTTSDLRLRNCTMGHPIGEHRPDRMKLSDDASELLLAQFRVLNRCHDEDEDCSCWHGGEYSSCSLCSCKYIELETE